MPRTVTIICPVHNESGNIPELAERIQKTLSAWPELDEWEVLLIDDASTDDSWAQIQAVTQGDPAHFLALQHPQRRGQTACFQTGFARAKYRVSLTMDSDLQVFPEEIPHVLKPILEGQYEMVCTYNDPQRDVYHKQRYDRSTVSYIGNIFMRVLFNSPVKDAGGNFLAVETRYLRQVELGPNDGRYLLPISMRRGLKRDKITEVGCEFGPRIRGKSKYNLFKKAVQGFPEMIRLKIRLLRGAYDNPPLHEEGLI